MKLVPVSCKHPLSLTQSDNRCFHSEGKQTKIWLRPSRHDKPVYGHERGRTYSSGAFVAQNIQLFIWQFYPVVKQHFLLKTKARSCVVQPPVAITRLREEYTWLLIRHHNIIIISWHCKRPLPDMWARYAPFEHPFHEADLCYAAWTAFSTSRLAWNGHLLFRHEAIRLNKES